MIFYLPILLLVSIYVYTDARKINNKGIQIKPFGWALLVFFIPITLIGYIILRFRINKKSLETENLDNLNNFTKNCLRVTVILGLIIIVIMLLISWNGLLTMYKDITIDRNIPGTEEKQISTSTITDFELNGHIIDFNPNTFTLNVYAESITSNIKKEDSFSLLVKKPITIRIVYETILKNNGNLSDIKDLVVNKKVTINGVIESGQFIAKEVLLK